MFGSFGFPELMLIFVVALLVFGPRKLPEIGRTLGKALGEFRKATDDLKNTIEREVQVEEQKQLLAQIRPASEVVSRTEPVVPVEAVEPLPTPVAPVTPPHES
jgi:sec-independent protein translocase protein TatA